MLLVVAALSFGDPLRLQKVSKLERCCALHHLRCIHGASLRVSTLARASAAAILLATALSLAAAPGLAGAAGRSLEWRHLDVDARLDASGDLHVVERQAMVFTGDWNGGERVFRLERGQRLALERVLRVGDDGVARPLSEGSLDAVDRFAWAGARVLRWRSRAPRDPPFDSTEITYALEYTLSGVLVRTGGATYRLEHDFAFPDRPGPIREVRARLALDPAWDAVAGPLELVRRDVPPGAGAVLVAELRFVGPGAAPAAGAGPARRVATGPLGAPFPAPLRAPLVATMAAALAAALVAVWRHGRARGFFDPPLDPGAIDARWLGENVLAFPPEVIGAAWDDRVGAPEVSAVLARMAAERKLETGLERRFLGLVTVLRLRLLVDRATLAGYERRLVDGLFFDGDTTDTVRLRRHYRRTGFDPASRMSGEVRTLARALAPRERRPASPWLGAAALLALALGVGALAFAQGDEPFLLATAPIPGLVLLLLSGIAAASFSTASGGRLARAVAAVLPLVLWSAGVAWLAWGGAGASAGAVLSGALLWGAGLVLAAGHARTPLVPKAIEARRRLAAARAFFARELRSPSPRLLDEWIPYLLALGLGRGLDRWVRVHGAVGSAPSVASARGVTGTGGARWTGGGGAFSGGGASGSWAALGSISSAVASSSVSSGGGGSSSGGGGGGGW